MKDLQNLEIAELVDLLSEYTSTYTRMFAERNRSDDFFNVKAALIELQKEIRFRNEAARFSGSHSFHLPKQESAES